MANLIRRENRDVAQGTGRQWDPFSMMEALLRLDPFRSETGWSSGAVGFTPKFDLKESKDAYVLKADLPGVQDKDLEINVTGNTLTISGQRQEERFDESDRYYTVERSYGQFARTLTLPEGADLEHVNAELKDGVLTVGIPKRPEVQPRRISIGKSGGGSVKS